MIKHKRSIRPYKQYLIKIFTSLYLIPSLLACNETPLPPPAQQSFDTFHTQYPKNWLVYGDTGASRKHRTILINTGDESFLVIEAYRKNTEQTIPSASQRVKYALMTAVESEEERNNANFTVGEVDLAGSRGTFVEVAIDAPKPRMLMLESYRRETENYVFLLTFQTNLKEHDLIKPYVELIYTSLTEE